MKDVWKKFWIPIVAGGVLLFGLVITSLISWLNTGSSLKPDGPEDSTSGSIELIVILSTIVVGIAVVLLKTQGGSISIPKSGLLGKVSGSSGNTAWIDGATNISGLLGIWIGVLATIHLMLWMILGDIWKAWLNTGYPFWGANVAFLGFTFFLRQRFGGTKQVSTFCAILTVLGILIVIPWPWLSESKADAASLSTQEQTRTELNFILRTGNEAEIPRARVDHEIVRQWTITLLPGGEYQNIDVPSRGSGQDIKWEIIDPDDGAIQVRINGGVPYVDQPGVLYSVERIKSTQMKAFGSNPVQVRITHFIPAPGSP